ncbi:MAG TPA: hypothetical protein VMB50_05420 [Myxococcales bacterium]|nr:hypothetical protein [Myxococcales bacterium]
MNPARRIAVVIWAGMVVSGITFAAAVFQFPSETRWASLGQE